MRTLLTLIALIAAQAFAHSVFAQAWPAKPGRIIVTAAPGGTLDALARVLSEYLPKATGQPWPVETRPGVSGNIGAEFVINAPADGYTVLVCPPGPFSVNPHLLRSMPFDPARDLIPITKLAVAPLLLLVHPSVPAKDLNEVIAWARSGGKVNFASQGIGSITQLAMELLRSKHPFEANHIPYKGSATAAADLLAGHVLFAFDNATQALPNVRAGRLRAIAVAERKRLNVAPDIPTFEESGLPGFEANTWFALSVRAKTPKDIVNRLHAEAVRAMNRPEVVERFARNGVDVATSSSPEEFAAFVKADSDKWGAVIRAIGAKAD
jgi:tripartite-type tricarboxylate transporter receptor subunit TctC